MGYMDNVNEDMKEYFTILEKKFPFWLNEYINTKELLKQKHISMTCGTIYSNLFESSFFYSSMDHSIATALIVWHFTNDKKQTLAGLFHDIATPAFKHCIDFLNGDYMLQESTEDLTKKIIENSSDIMRLLKRDNILVEEICDYHIYPIADNDTPRLSADRLEYSLSNALFTYKMVNSDDIKKIYNDIIVTKNEENIDELGFKTKEIACQFVAIASELGVVYRDDKTRYSMQLLADIIHKLNEQKILFKHDLYNKTESQILDIISGSKYKEIFNTWKNATSIQTSKKQPEGVYFVHHEAKVRYIDPLINNQRASAVCIEAKEAIEKNLSYDMSKYVYLNSKFDD